MLRSGCSAASSAFLLAVLCGSPIPRIAAEEPGPLERSKCMLQRWSSAKGELPKQRVVTEEEDDEVTLEEATVMSGRGEGSSFVTKASSSPEDHNSTRSHEQQPVIGLVAAAIRRVDRALAQLPAWPLGPVWAFICIVMFAVAKLAVVGKPRMEHRLGADGLFRQRVCFTLVVLLTLGGGARVAAQSGQLPEVWVVETSEAVVAFVAAALTLTVAVLLCLRSMLFRRWSMYEQEGRWEPIQAHTDAGGRVRLRRNPKTCRYWAMKTSFQEQCGLQDNFLFCEYLSESFMMSTMNLMELSYTSICAILLPALLELIIHLWFARRLTDFASAEGVRILIGTTQGLILLLHAHLLVRINRQVLPVSEHPASSKVDGRWVKSMRRYAQALIVFDFMEVSNFAAQLWSNTGPLIGSSPLWLLGLGASTFVNLFIMIPLIVEWLSFIEACDAPHQEIIEFVSSHLKSADEGEEEIATALGLQYASFHHLFLKCDADKDGVVHASEFFHRMKEQYWGLPCDGDSDPLEPRKAG